MPNLKKILLRFTGITHKGLVDCGFNADNLYYKLADLHIYVYKKRYFFYDENGVKRKIRNMLQVSNLVYGITDYERE